MNSEHNTEMTQGSIQRIDRTTRLICHVGDMIRFPRYNVQEEESRLKVIAEHKCILKHGYRKEKSAMFKDDMLPLLKTRENFFLTFPVKF